MATEKLILQLDGRYTGKKAFDAAEKDIDGLKRKIDQLEGALAKGSGKSSNKFKELGGSLGVFNKGLGQSVSKLGATSGALGGLTAMMGGPLVAAAAAAAAAIGTFAVMSYNAAKNSQAEWAKFKGVVESAGQSFENSKKVVSDYASVSGRKVTDVRTAFQQLTAAGINPSAEALRAVNELAIGLRGNMADAATAYTRIMKGGQGAGRTLAKLGLTMEDISTGGKVDTAKLQAVLEQKFGKAADNFAKTAEAAQNRLTDTWTRLQVRFGTLLLGPATDLMNALSFSMDALIRFGEIVWGLFGGADAFKYAMEYISPALDDLWKAVKELIDPVTGVGDQAGSLQFMLTSLGWIIAQSIKVMTSLVRFVKWNIDMAQKFGSALQQAANIIWNLPGTIRGYLVSAGQSIYNAARNFPGWLWNTIVNALPKIRWPTPGEIMDAIRHGLGFAGPSFSGGMIQRWKANLTAEGLAAQRAAVVNTYNSSPAAQSAASQATSNMGIFGTGWSLFSGPNFDNLGLNYEYYRGSKKSPWTSDGCLSGNCVDMTRGLLQYAAASGSKRLGIAAGTWDGSPHVWAMIDGKAYDPSRKALEGTWSPPAAGPGNRGSGNTYVFQAPVYDWNAFKKHVAKANDRIIAGVF